MMRITSGAWITERVKGTEERGETLGIVNFVRIFRHLVIVKFLEP